MAKEKKKTLSEVFTTAKSLKKKEVFNSIRKYCTQITNDDMKEVHVNIIDYFELNEKDYYFDFVKFQEEVTLQKKLKIESGKKKQEKEFEIEEIEIEE